MDKQYAYIVTSGDYSDYSIDAVFLDKEEADKYAEIRNEEHEYSYYKHYVETHEIGARGDRFIIEVFVEKNGDTRFNYNPFMKEGWHDMSPDTYIAHVNYNPNKEVMVKAARDKRNMAEAEREGLV